LTPWGGEHNDLIITLAKTPLQWDLYFLDEYWKNIGYQNIVCCEMSP